MCTQRQLRRFAALALVLGLLAQLIPAQTVAARKSTSEVLVSLHPAANPRAIAARAGLTQLEQLDDLPIYRFAIADGSDAREKSVALNTMAGVNVAEPNLDVVSPWAQRRVIWAVGSDTESYTTQWAPARLGLAKAHEVTRGAGVTVAILDTGVDPSHPALQAQLVQGYDFVDGDSDPSEQGDPAADGAYGHGTHVAGLVALVAPEAEIMPLRTLRPDGSGDLWTQLVALRYATQQGAQVINMSFSFGERSRIFDHALAVATCTVAGSDVCRGQQAGAVAVAAAGNTGAAVREFPGASSQPGLLGVAASTEADTLAPFSTFGPWLRLAAPGDAIVSTVPGGGYAAWSGTSMATPLVAGIVALVRSNNPLLSPGDVARHIVDTAAPINARVHRRADAAAAVHLSKKSDTARTSAP